MGAAAKLKFLSKIVHLGFVNMECTMTAISLEQKRTTVSYLYYQYAENDVYSYKLVQI